ncbi:hypothetical protein VNI00_015578 [Paramarasmius palmivorus]|uniref:Uncharacterized protein n=1 Tax=Paramarasmius palmivorus TaxID=297713 RepID=A0AAW0BJA9_9AGAR
MESFAGLQNLEPRSGSGGNPQSSPSVNNNVVDKLNNTEDPPDQRPLSRAEDNEPELTPDNIKLTVTVAEQQTLIRCLFTTLQMMKTQMYLIKAEKEMMETENKALVEENTHLEQLVQRMARQANKVACASYRSRHLEETRRRARERMRRKRGTPSMRFRHAGKANLQPPKYRHKESQQDAAETFRPASSPEHNPGQLKPSQNVGHSTPPLVLKFRATTGSSYTSSTPVLHSSSTQNRVFIHYNH